MYGRSSVADYLLPHHGNERVSRCSMLVSILINVTVELHSSREVWPEGLQQQHSSPPEKGCETQAGERQLASDGK